MAFGDTSAATGAGDILVGISTAAASTEIPLKIAQGTGIATTGNPVASALTVTGGAGGAVAATATGNVGGPINLTTGAGSAGGATSGTGGAGGAINLTAGNGGAATSGSTTGAGGNIVITPGSAGGTGTAGVQGNVQIVGGTVGAATTTPALSVTDTWNTTGVVDAALLVNVTNTASGTASKLLDLQVGGASQGSVDKAGNLLATTSVGVGTAPACTAGTAGGICFTEGTDITNVASTGALDANSTTHELTYQSNGSALKGMLVRAQPGAVHQTAQTAAISTATLCAASAGACNTAGQYHVHWDFIQTGTACSLTGATAGATFLLTWTDTNATAHSAVSLLMQSEATGAGTPLMTQTFFFQSALGSAYASGDLNISTNGSVIQYGVGYTACTTGTGTFQLDAVVTRIQ
jgi:hypothetical protein